MLLFVDLGGLMVAERLLEAPGVGYVHGVALGGVGGSATGCCRGLVRLDHRRYHQPSLVIASKFTLIPCDNLVRCGAGIPAGEQPSAHPLRPALVYQSLEVIVGSIRGVLLSQYVRRRAVVRRLRHRLLVFPEVLLGRVYFVMVLRRPVKGLRLQHLAYVLEALLRLLLLVRAIEQLCDVPVLFRG